MNKKIEYKHTIQIIAKDEIKYIKKKNVVNKEKLFSYLNSQDFNHYLPPSEISNDYELYPYIEEESTDKNLKAANLIDIVAELHNKTTSYHKINKDSLLEIYNLKKENISSLRTYYYELQDYLETKEFPSPEEQLLLNNISNIYKAINYSEYKLNSWYEKVKQTNKIRHVQLHNNLLLEHLLVGRKHYLISWDKSNRDLPIHDFIIFYKNEFNNLNMEKLFLLYQRKYKYTEEEQLLFESLISIPPKITFQKSHLINTIETRKHINYVEKTSEFLSKNNEENQEDNK